MIHPMEKTCVMESGCFEIHGSGS